MSDVTTNSPGRATPFEHESTTDTAPVPMPAPDVDVYVCTRCMTQSATAMHHSPASCIAALIEQRDRLRDTIDAALTWFPETWTIDRQRKLARLIGELETPSIATIAKLLRAALESTP